MNKSNDDDKFFAWPDGPAFSSNEADSCSKVSNVDNNQ